MDEATRKELEDQFMDELGGAMNDYFTRPQLKRFLLALKRIEKIAKWNDRRGVYFRYESVVYIESRKFKFTILNIDNHGIMPDEFSPRDRKPMEVMVQLPIEVNYNGLKNNHITLKSVDSNLGGMFLEDFHEFIKIVNGWVRTYSYRRYREFNYVEEEEEIVNNDFIDEDDYDSEIDEIHDNEKPKFNLFNLIDLNLKKKTAPAYKDDDYDTYEDDDDDFIDRGYTGIK